MMYLLIWSTKKKVVFFLLYPLIKTAVNRNSQSFFMKNIWNSCWLDQGDRFLHPIKTCLTCMLSMHLRSYTSDWNDQLAVEPDNELFIWIRRPRAVKHLACRPCVPRTNKFSIILKSLWVRPCLLTARHDQVVSSRLSPDWKKWKYYNKMLAGKNIATKINFRQSIKSFC